MNHTCEWLDESKTILLITALPNGSWEAAYQAVEDQMKHIASVKHNVYTIYDLTHASKLPQGVALPNLQRLMTKRQPNQALTIYVGVGYLVQKFMEMARSMFGLNSIFNSYRFVSSVDEALQVVNEHQHERL
jgi:hypothetical protein